MLLSKTQNSKKFNASRLSKAIQIAGVCALAALPGVSSAADVQATVTVSNTLTLNVIDQLDFGTIAAAADTSGGNEESFLTMTAADDGTVTTNTTPATPTSSYIHEITQGTPAYLEVIGAPADTAINITISGLPLNLTGTTSNADQADHFILDQINYIAASGSGTGSGSLASPTALTTDATTGALAFYLAGRIKTATTPAGAGGAVNSAYDDGTYSGTFQVTVQY